MKTLVLSLLLTAHSPATLPQPIKPFNVMNLMIPAETVATNTTSTGFTLTMYHISDNQTRTFSMPPGFNNIGNKWQLVAGHFNLTFTPVGGASYGPTKFLANTGGIYRYNAVNTGSVTLSNIEFYVGGGNQIIIEPI